MVFQHYPLLRRLSLLDNVRHAGAPLAPAGAAPRPTRPPSGTSPPSAYGAPREATRPGVGRHAAAPPSRGRSRSSPSPPARRAFGALDALTRARLQAQLIDLWRSESDTEIVLMVTHGIEEAILLADRIVVMGNGPGPSVVDVIPVDLPVRFATGLGDRRTGLPRRAGPSPGPPDAMPTRTPPRRDPRKEAFRGS